MQKDLREKYKSVDPIRLQNQGLLEPARNGGYVCPFCGNGTGEDGTGVKVDAVKDGFKGYCFRCHNFFDVFDLIAAKYRYNVKTQFSDIVRIAEELFGDTSESNFHAPKIVEKEIKDFRSYIISTFDGLNLLFSEETKTWRGLTKATMIKFACGYDPKYFFGGMATPRVIIPTSFSHYLARYTGDVSEAVRMSPKLHQGTKEIFGLKYALNAVKENPDLLVYAVEGEIDAMSIYQSGYVAVAFSGSSVTAFQMTFMKQFPSGTKFILMLDADKTGRRQSQKIASQLAGSGFFVSVKFLDEKFGDSNAWLQGDPEGLKAELARIYAEAAEEFRGIKPSGVEGVVEITPAYKPPNPPDALDEIFEGIQHTRTEIPTCPIDLVVPENFLFGPSGLKVRVFDKKTGKEKDPVIFSKTPIVPTRILRKKDRSGTQVELAYYERAANVWHKLVVPATTIAKTPLITDLADFGVDVNTPHSKDLSNFLMRIQNHDDNSRVIPHVTVFEQTGWTSNDCDNFIYPPETEIDGQKFIVQNGGFDYEKKFATRGDKEQWRDLFLNLYNPEWLGWARYAVGLVLAAPITKICNTGNWQGILVANSGAGKSAVAELAISIFGNPKELHTTFNGTANFTDELSPKLNDLPCWIDEFQSADESTRKNFQNLIYNYAEGKSRGRLSRNADMKIQYKFNGTRLCTSEQVVMQNHFMQGARNRVIQVQGFQGLSDHFAREIHQTVAKTYGHYGRPFIECVKAYKDEIRRTYLETFEKYKKMNFVSHHLQNLVQAYTALEFFHRMLKAETSPDDEIYFVFRDYPSPLEYLERDIKFFRGILPTRQEANNTVRAQDFLSEICVTRRRNFHGWQKLSSMIDGEDVKSLSTFVEASMMPALGCIFENGDVAFFPRALDNFLSENHYPPAETLMRDFYEKGLLKVSESDAKLKKAFKSKARIGNLGPRDVYYFPKFAFDPQDR